MNRKDLSCYYFYFPIIQREMERDSMHERGERQRDERREARSEENGSLFLSKSSFPISVSSQSTV